MFLFGLITGVIATVAAIKGFAFVKARYDYAKAVVDNLKAN